MTKTTLQVVKTPETDENTLKKPVMIALDLYIARRKRTHTVIDGDNEPVFHATRISDCLLWIEGQGVNHVTLVDEDSKFSVDFTVVPF